MPRKSAVPPKESIQVIKKQYFETEPLSSWSAKVWKEMSALGGRWTSAACYTNVRNDRNSILSIARQEMGVIVLPKNDLNNNSNLLDSTVNTTKSDSNESNNNESYFKLPDDVEELDTFDLILTEQQWNEIKPDIKQNAKDNSKLKLKPGIWTNEIAISFFQQYRLPCAFIFKRATVTFQNDTIFTIKIIGLCKSKKCRNIFRGYAEKQIGVEGLTIKIKTRDTRTENHEVIKRPLNGQWRKKLQKDLKVEKSSVWRKRRAKDIMRPCEAEPPILPKDNILRQAYYEGINEKLGIQMNDCQDLIGIIEKMSLKAEYIGLIQDIGLRPFHVFYSTRAQLHAYKEYCRLNKIRNCNQF